VKRTLVVVTATGAAILAFGFLAAVGTAANIFAKLDAKTE
jgi:hypothetical protein